MEVVLDEIAVEFAGEDVLKPLLREDIDEAKAKAVQLHSFLQELWTGEFELPEADARRSRRPEI